MLNSITRALILGAILVAVPSSVAVAQEEATDVHRLTLGEALETALKNNLELVSARYQPDLARESIEAEDANFDVGFEGTYQRSEGRNATVQVSTVTGSVDDTITAGVGQSTKIGASYTFGLRSNRNEVTGLNVLAPLSYFSNLSASVEFPLLQGLGKEVTTERLVLARANLRISLADLEGQAERIIESVEGAYWDVLAAREALRISRLRLKRSEDLLELNRKKVEVGTLAPIEITQAEAEVASNLEGVIVAEVQLLDAEDELRRLLAIPATDPLWDTSIDPSDRPVYDVRDIDVDEAMETAMDSRPEIFSARQTLRNMELSERVAKKNVRHELDLSANYNPIGAGQDQPNPIPPPELLEKADLGDSISTIGDFYNWSATLTYRIPIGNRAAKASYATARINREKAEVDLDNQTQTVRVEVRRAVRAVTSGIKRVEAAQANVVLQRKKLEAEQKKFENGMSTSFEVLTFQNDLADSELSEIRARLAYVKALAALERSKGTLLEVRNLSLQ